MGMESFGGFKPKPRQEEVPETKVDTSGLAADVEKFAKTEDGKQAMGISERESFRDKDGKFHYLQAESQEAFEKNTEEFNTYIQERVEISRDKVNNILHRFQKLSANKKELFKRKMDNTKGNLLRATTAVTGVGGLGTFFANPFIQGGLEHNTGVTVALVAVITALVSGIASKTYVESSPEKIQKVKDTIEQSQQNYTRALEDVLSQTQNSQENQES